MWFRRKFDRNFNRKMCLVMSLRLERHQECVTSHHQSRQEMMTTMILLLLPRMMMRQAEQGRRRDKSNAISSRSDVSLTQISTSRYYLLLNISLRDTDTVLIGSTRPTEQCHFSWPWVTLRLEWWWWIETYELLSDTRGLSAIAELLVQVMYVSTRNSAVILHYSVDYNVCMTKTWTNAQHARQIDNTQTFISTDVLVL